MDVDDVNVGGAGANPPCDEGDWFAIPLAGGGWAAGVVARRPLHSCGVLLGYFFGPAHHAVPAADQLNHLTASNCAYIKVFADSGLQSGEWPVIGRNDSWDRSGWPLPAFIYIDPVTGKYWKIEVSEDDLTHETTRKRCRSAEARKLPRFGLAGHGYIVQRLSYILTK